MFEKVAKESLFYSQKVASSSERFWFQFSGEMLCGISFAVSFKLFTEGVGLLSESLPEEAQRSLNAMRWTEKILMQIEIFWPTEGVIKMQ